MKVSENGMHMLAASDEERGDSALSGCKPYAWGVAAAVRTEW